MNKSYFCPSCQIIIEEHHVSDTYNPYCLECGTEAVIANQIPEEVTKDFYYQLHKAEVKK